ncbi:permease [Vibrio ziniensis]|uniref:Permease n=1 Tax=Vibrio ziniensis TaxID=2711221 RepID=A0A6G7CQF0_9VIBR|nr:permease [Vibrio ziniensis]QIH44238.1 permease [Vibrio ziniensis]
MFWVFTSLADWFTYQLLSLDAESKMAQAIHFFVEDTSKILVLLLVMIYVIALIRASLKVEKVRDYLSGKKRVVGYLMGSIFGAITPFCSCSSIPVFLGFTTAGIPLGITMAFLITSPLVNEIAVLLLLSLLGWKFTLLYVLSGMVIGVISGWFLDMIKADRWLQPFAAKAMHKSPKPSNTDNHYSSNSMSFSERNTFAKNETREIFVRVWKWVLIGVGVGAALHGYVPDGWIESHLGSKQWWSVPASVLIGIPLYSNATGVIPIMESLLRNGLPVGTTLAFCMSTVAASIPEFVMLKQVMQWRLLGMLFALLLTAFTIIGWMFNLITWQV